MLCSLLRVWVFFFYSWKILIYAKHAKTRRSQWVNSAAASDSNLCSFFCYSLILTVLFVFYFQWYWPFRLTSDFPKAQNTSGMRDISKALVTGTS